MSLPSCQTAMTVQASTHQRGSTSPTIDPPPPLLPSFLPSHPSPLFKGGLLPSNCAVTLNSLGQRLADARGLIWKRVIYMGIFDSWRWRQGKVANWRRAAGSTGSPGTALPSRFATTFSHAVSISSQVERQKSVSRVFRLSPRKSEGPH